MTLRLLKVLEFTAIFTVGAVIGQLIAVVQLSRPEPPAKPPTEISTRSPEITVEQYRQIHHWLDADSDLKPFVAPLMEDHQITRDEFDAIGAQADELQLRWVRGKLSQRLEAKP
jgi:hypothetical protein